MKKRIALAAAAALAGGLLVAAPASAVGESTFGADTTAIAGPANYVNVTVTEGAYASAYVTVTGGTLYDGSTTKIVNNNGANVLQVKTPVNGTITLNVYDEVSAGVYAATASDSLVITVGAAPVVVVPVYNHTTVSALTTGGLVYGSASGTVYAPQGTLNAPATVSSFTISQFTSSNDDTLSVTGSANVKPVVVSLSGVGVLSDASNPNATYLAYSGSTDNVKNIAVKNDGRTGTATITISVDGAVVATKTVVFYGAVAKYTATVSKAQAQAGVAAGDTGLLLTVKSMDAAGNYVPVGGYAALVGDTATFSLNTDDVVGVETYTVKASAKYARTVTVGNGAAETATVVANFVTAGVATIVVTADKASYAPGEKATVSVVAKNADGVAVGDDTYNLTIGGSTAFYGAPATLAIVNGAASFTSYMPVAQGPVIMTAALGASATVTLTLAVVDPAAAAQAAAITALQTSVATLTTTVASLVASMTAQIKVINATMLKIQKQLAALRLQVNKL